MTARNGTPLAVGDRSPTTGRCGEEAVSSYACPILPDGRRAWRWTQLDGFGRIVVTARGVGAFESRVIRQHDGCWTWKGGLNEFGYGTFGGRLAHRVALSIAERPVPATSEVDHLCRTRACVNPAHLEAVSRQENIARVARSEKCRRGHFNWSYPKGGRKCMDCKRARDAKRHACRAWAAKNPKLAAGIGVR